MYSRMRSRPATSAVQRSTESMQQSFRMSTWRVKNQATLHLTPPVPKRSIAFAPNACSGRIGSLPPLAARSMLFCLQLVVRKSHLTFPDRLPALTASP